MKRVGVLGSTGSIGTQTIDVVRMFPDELRITALAAGRNTQALKRQAAELGVKNLAAFCSDDPDVPDGIRAIENLATSDDIDVLVVSVSGVIGLMPTIKAIEAGKQIALASKEVLVAAGEIVMPLAHRHNVTITPIDSEHSAIFQCLQGYRPDQIDKLILTASGGPFRGKRADELETVSLEQALNHPTWTMGGKITVDSATLMNKGLESIEAKWLFGVEIDQVEIVVHPQSIVHSFVQFKDGSTLGQLGWPDMRLPIAYALLYPERRPNDLRRWSPVDTPTLTFEPLDETTFRCPVLARESVKAGGTMPCIMNAANEEAVGLFLARKIGFLQIAELVERTMEGIPLEEASLANILKADNNARAFVRNLIETH
jgi:1-deoxy-D-xylulose-5-phosphate reductoisomerase